MPHYKAPDNSVYFLDHTNDEHFLPKGSIPITDEEATILSLANQPKVDPKAIVQAQINMLEREAMMPRPMREFMIKYSETNNQTDTIEYKKVKELDTQIKALRAEL